MLVTAVAAASLSCNRGPSSPPRVKAAENSTRALPAPPSGLAFIVSLPSLDHGLDGWLAFADAVTPAFGADLRTEIADQLAQIDDVDRTKPVRVVVLASAHDNEDWGLLVASGDPKKLEEDFGAVRLRGSWAFLAAPTTIDKLAPWAFESLAPQRVPDVPVVTVYPSALLDQFANDVAEARAEWVSDPDTAMRSIKAAWFDGMIAGVRQCERVEVRLEANVVRANVELSVFARPGTSIARFVAIQKPATFQLLPRLSADGAMAVAAGRGVPELVARIYTHLIEQFAAVLPKTPMTTSPETVRRINTMLAGEIAIAVARTEGAFLPDVTILAESPSEEGFKALFEDGVRVGMTALDPPPYADVPIAQVTAAELRYAYWDDLTGFVLGDQSRQRIERLVDVSRGRAAYDGLPPRIAAAFDEARRRKESFLLVVDLVAFATKTPGEDGLAIGLGFADGAIRLRASIDARHLAAFFGVIGASAAF
jgi:hypothetical protein